MVELAVEETLQKYMLNYIIQGVAYGFAAGVQPGPFQTYLASQTLEHPLKRTLPMAAAPLISDGPILVMVLFILSKVPQWLLQMLEIAGGVFVVYLAFGVWKSWNRRGIFHSVDVSGSGKTLLQAALVNFINPAPYLFWSLVTGPILLAGWRQAPVNGIGMLAGFYGTMIASCSVIIMIFSVAKRLGDKLTHRLQLFSALALGGFGLYHIILGIYHIM